MYLDADACKARTHSRRHSISRRVAAVSFATAARTRRSLVRAAVEIEPQIEGDLFVP